MKQADAKNGEAQQADTDDGRFHGSVISQISAVHNNSVLSVDRAVCISPFIRDVGDHYHGLSDSCI